jgi:two-component system chemotaxis sensor kinase CheA
MDELKLVFIEEAEDLFEGISSILYSLEERNITESEIDELFRNFHTLKGGSGSVGFEQFVKLVHLLENFLDKLKHKEVEFTADMVDFLIDITENLETVLKEEANGSLDDDKVDELYNFIKNTINSFKQEGNLQANEADEIVDILDKLKNIQKNNQLELDETFRLIHTLKSASMMLHLESFKEYVAIVESVLMRMREEGEDKELITKIIKDFLNNSETILNNEINGNIFLNEKIVEKFAKKYSHHKNFEIFEENKGYVLFDDELQKTDTSNNKTIQKKQKKVQKSDKLTKTKETERQNNTNKTKTFKELVSSSSIRVNLVKIENLMNRVGDLVITKSMLYEFANSFDEYEIKSRLYEKVDILDRYVRELQDAVMSIRMVGMDSIYSKLPKIIRDVSKKLNKKVKFEHFGDNVEIDKLMAEALIDPLTHILRNAVDHGIETPQERKKLNKPEYGKITIRASQESGQIILQIEDDGKGIDAQKVAEKALKNGIISEDEYNRMDHDEKVMLIFSPGLSTAEKVSDISGRGVGMDVVMNNIHSIGGNIKVKTELNKGTTFIIALPLTLAILDGLNIKVGNYNFIIPLNMVMESFQPVDDIIKNVVDGDNEVLMVRDEFIPVIRLHKFFGIKPRYEKLTEGIVIISMVANKKVALFIDEFYTQEQIVVKSLEKNYKKVKGISAATIRGDGSVGLILDIIDIVEESR